MKTVRFGLIGCGLMAREFASAAARWCHLTEDVPKPEIVGICSVVPKEMEWFNKHFSDIKYSVSDYKELLDKDDIDAIYCAVPHNLHEEFYIDDAALKQIVIDVFYDKVEQREDITVAE